MKTFFSNLSLICVAVLSMLIFTGCAGFQKDWKRAAETYPTPRPDILGRWQGTWQSKSSGHTNSLRCLVTRGENDIYFAKFHAKYKKFFTWSFGYTVPLRVERTNGVYQFDGEADLGKLAGGIYRYKGEATAEKFFSTYDSKYDHGTFTMTRP